MATSGSKSITVTSYDTLKFSWERTGYSIADNTSTISWKMQLIATGAGKIVSSAAKDWSVTVNGTKYSGTNYIGISNNSTKTLASGTTTIKHNDDGSKSFNYSFSQEFAITFAGSSIGTKSGSGSGTLDTIPRASSFGTISGNTIGSNITININRNSDKFTHTLWYSFGNLTWQEIGSSVGTSKTFTPPLSICSQIPNSTSGTMTLILRTFNGSTQVGSDVYKTITVNVPSSVVPSISSINLSEGNSAFSIDKYVQYYSKLKVVTNASGSYGSTIKSYKITGIDSNTYTSSNFTSSELQLTGTRTITVEVTDSRGRKATKTATYECVASSSPSLVTWPETTQNVTIGDTITVHMNRKANLTHTVRYTWGNKSGTIATGVVDNCQWTIPMNFCDNIPNNTSAWGTISVDTYAGNTFVGTKSVAFTGNVPNSVVPSIESIELSEGNDEVGLGVFVQNKSKLDVNIKANGSYGSTIKSYKVTGIDNTTYNSNEFTSEVLTTDGTRTVTVTVTDSRGRTATKTTTYKCIAYISPVITFTNVLRCDEDGTTNENGVYVKYSFEAFISSIENKNTKSFKLGYKAHGTNDYTYIDIESDNYELNQPEVVISDITFDENLSYDFEFFVSDYFSSNSLVRIVGTAFTLINYNKNGMALAFGKVSEAGENEKLLEIALKTIIRDNLEVYWKENKWGDKFALFAEFNGYEDANKLKFQGAIGNEEADPELYDLMTLSAKSGNLWIKGAIEATNLLIDRGYVADMNEIKSTTGIYNFSDTTLNRPNSSVFASWGCVMNFGLSSWRYQIAIGNYLISGQNKLLAIRAYVNDVWTDWHIIG